MLGGILRSVINPINLMQVAMGPAGWASLAMRTLSSQIGMNVLQQLGERLGLPTQAINLAQSAFAAQMGQPGLVGQNINSVVSSLFQDAFSPRDVAQAQRQTNDIVRDMTNAMLERLRNGDDREEGSVGAGGQSRLVALARALGKVMDGKMDEMIKIGGQIDKSKKTGQLSAQMQALSQELSLVATALNTAIKSVGEANTNMARKN